jgi:hypothetical protein
MVLCSALCFGLFDDCGICTARKSRKVNARRRPSDWPAAADGCSAGLEAARGLQRGGELAGALDAYERALAAGGCPPAQV